MRVSTLTKNAPVTPMLPCFDEQAEAAADEAARIEKQNQRKAAITSWADNFGQMDSDPAFRDFC